jgi:RNA polymerase sigma-70 factor (ECF subfamily)
MKDAFEQAYALYADALFRYALLKVGDRETAKDVLQDTFKKTWEFIAAGNTITHWRTFLYTAATRLIIDHYRKKKTLSLDLLADSGFEPIDPHTVAPEIMIDGEQAIALLGQLPPDYRDAVFMRYVDELTLSEIAAITGESENTIAVRVHRGLQKLKKLFPYE